MKQKNTVKNKVLHIVLIRPSKYDTDGYILQYRKGVLPSNTLAVLYGLSKNLCEKDKLREKVTLKAEIIDETVQKINFSRITAYSRRKGVRSLVCLCGVQSNQFPRAVDIARHFRKEELAVAIGGFHVSGRLAFHPELTPELREVVREGISLVAGEVDESFHIILNDVLSGNLKSVYNFLDQKPRLNDVPLPVMHRKNNYRYMIPTMATLDCGRGCPYKCSFCCVINVQGRKMRYRDPLELEKVFIHNYYKNKIKNYFFTDDNFSRNVNWERIFDIFIRLREEKGIKLGFMMQIDTQSYKIPRFIAKAGRAGCTQAFIGVESLNPRNLAGVDKVQNHVKNFQDLNRMLLEHKIVSHAAYILGFPDDTEDSLRQDIRKLIETGFCQASFFIMTPLPGSRDYERVVKEKIPLDKDLNNYDTFAPVMQHPHMSAEKITELYQLAWDTFFSVENMKKILQKLTPENYYKMLGNFIWYRHAVFIDRIHPMFSGFMRMRDRKTRRPGMPRESFSRFHAGQWSRAFRNLRKYVQLIREFEEIWLQTRPRKEWEIRVIRELRKLKAGIRERIHFRDLLQAFQRAKLSRPSRIKYYLAKLFLPASQKFLYTRAHLNRYWAQAKRKIKAGGWLRVNLIKVVYHFFYELGLFFSLLGEFLRIKIRRGLSMLGSRSPVN